MVGRSTQRALNLKKNWVSTDASPGLAASVLSNNQGNITNNTTTNEIKGDHGIVGGNQQTTILTANIQKERDQSQKVGTSVKKFERTVPSISSSINNSRGNIINKGTDNSDQNVDNRLKSLVDRLSSQQSLLKVK